MNRSLAVVGAVVLVAAGVGAVLLLRPKPVPPLASVPAATSTAETPSSAATVSATSSPIASATPTTPAAEVTVPSVTTPWAVVSAYYGDVESGDYREAWALINSGATTGQTHQQFVSGYACTGAQQLSEVSQFGDQVTFDLAATDLCTGGQQQFTGTDTVRGGKIVKARIHQVS